MQGSQLVETLVHAEGVEKIVRSGKGKPPVVVSFDYLGICLASGGGSNQEEAESAVVADAEAVSDLISVVEYDPEELGKIYDLEMLKSLSSTLREE